MPEVILGLHLHKIIEVKVSTKIRHSRVGFERQRHQNVQSALPAAFQKCHGLKNEKGTLPLTFSVKHTAYQKSIMSDNPVTKQDSPLSIIASVAGILTVVIAIAATIYARLSYLSSADAEYFQVKRSLNWFKTESAWLRDVVKSRKQQRSERDANQTSGFRLSGDEREYEMYAFVLEQLGNLEKRLLELLAEVELEVSMGKINEGDGKRRLNWTLVPRRYSCFKTGSIASAWVPIRTKALELVRQREALCPRVLSAQLSMVLS